MDGVWLPAGGENPGARGFPDSRHTPRPGIAKGEAFSPLARPRQRQVGQSPQPTGRNRIKPNQKVSPRFNPLRQAQGERLRRWLVRRNQPPSVGPRGGVNGDGARSG